MQHDALTMILVGVAGGVASLAASLMVEMLRILVNPRRRLKMHRRSTGERIKAAFG